MTPAERVKIRAEGLRAGEGLRDLATTVVFAAVCLWFTALLLALSVVVKV